MLKSRWFVFAIISGLVATACSSDAAPSTQPEPATVATSSESAANTDATTADTAEVSSTSTVDASSTSTSTTVANTAKPNTIVGSLYYDIDADGVRDPDEAGLPGVLVSVGARSIATDSVGAFAFTDVSGTKNLRVNSGWFRTQCDALDCPPGPGPDNDVAVENQLLYARQLNADLGARIDVGLRPDWPGEISYPLSTAPDANAVDVAVRLSRIDVAGSETECFRAKKAEHVCVPGDHPTASLAIHNQGTEALTDVSISIESPPGLRSDQIVLSPDLPSPQGVVVQEVSAFEPNTRSAIISVKGPLPAASITYIDVRQVVEAGAAGSPQPYVTVNPYDRQVYARVLSVGNAGEADSALCPGWGACLSAAGPHDKLEEFDEMDESGWNIEGAIQESTQRFTLQGVWVAPLATGEPVAEISFTNTGTETLRNVQLNATLPAGAATDPHNTMWIAGALPDTLSSIWPGQVSPGGTVTIQIVLPLRTVGGEVGVEVASVATGRHPEGPVPFPQSSVDLAAFNAAGAVHLQIPGG